MSSTDGSTMTSQLLIEMPAEGAARLLTLSLLEQLSQYTTGSAFGDPRHVSRYAEPYRAAVRRLRACLTLYADALGDSVPRKGRRRVRRLVDASERLHRIDLQLAWVGRHLPQPGQRENAVPLGDGTRAATWLHERLAKRRERARRELDRAQTDARPLRRIAKRLGVYTTAVRLEAVPTQQSFARMTGDELLVRTDALGAAIRTTLAAGSHDELRRARQAAEQLGYLLEPLRAYADVEALSARVGELRAALDQLETKALVGRVIIRAGRRIAASQAGEALHAVIWPAPDVTPPLAAAPPNSRVPSSPEELHRGLMVLAESLHDEAARAAEALRAAWQESGGNALIERVGALALELQA